MYNIIMEMNYDNLPEMNCPKVDCHKKGKCCANFRKVVIPAMFDDSATSEYAPKNGLYCDTLVEYAANGHVYMYSSDGIPTLINPGVNVRLYDETGENTNGAMTQKATTEALDNKQDNLVAGENITIDGNVISAVGGGYIEVDDELSTTSENPVQNKVITNALSGKQEQLVAGDNIVIDGNVISATASPVTLYDEEGDHTDGAMTQRATTALKGSISGTGAPTISTAATYLGQDYVDIETGDYYYCFGIRNDGTEFDWVLLSSNNHSDWGTVVYAEGEDDDALVSYVLRSKSEYESLAFTSAGGTTTLNGEVISAGQIREYIFPNWRVEYVPNNFLCYCANLTSVRSQYGDTTQSEYHWPVTNIGNMVLARSGITTPVVLDGGGSISTTQIIIGDGFMSSCASWEGTLGVVNGKITAIGTNFMAMNSFVAPFATSTTLNAVETIGLGFLSGCTNFNQEFTITLCKKVGGYFLYNCSSFDKSATFLAMSEVGSYFMSGCVSFDSPVSLPKCTDIGDYFMSGCTVFNSTLEVPRMLYAGRMFLYRCGAFNQPLKFGTGASIDARGFLQECKSFNQPITIPYIVTSVADGFLYQCNALISPINLGDQEAPGSSRTVLSTTTRTAPSYATGMTLVGSKVNTWLTAYPNRTSSAYRKLINGNPPEGVEYTFQNTQDGWAVTGSDGSSFSHTDGGYTAGVGLTLSNREFAIDDTIVAMKSDLPTVNDAILTIQKNLTDIGTFTANQATNETINIEVPTTAADLGALPDTTKYGASLSLTIDNQTFVVTGQLRDQDGNSLGASQTIDLPLESVVVNGSYDETNQKIILTLQNGNTIDVPVGALVRGLQTEIDATHKLDADLVDDSTSINKFVTASDITTWNAKQDSLTAGQNITISNNVISATDTTYTAGVGLILTNNEFSVSTATDNEVQTALNNTFGA